MWPFRKRQPVAHTLTRVEGNDDWTSWSWECACGTSGNGEPSSECAEYAHSAHASEKEE